jgi:hypothetical protein
MRRTIIQIQVPIAASVSRGLEHIRCQFFQLLPKFLISDRFTHSQQYGCGVMNYRHYGHLIILSGNSPKSKEPLYENTVDLIASSRNNASNICPSVLI